jgi:hypothetical protein
VVGGGWWVAVVEVAVVAVAAVAAVAVVAAAPVKKVSTEMSMTLLELLR